MDTQGAKTYILAKLRNELPSGRTYHSLEHTLDVYANAIGIAEQEGVTGEDLALLKIGALFHDSGFTLRDRDHETAGCIIAREQLPRFGFTPEQVEVVCAMVMATRVPQSPRTELERILCDADLDYLGRPDFERIAQALFEEMRTFGSLTTEREWNELQERFLEGHRYFTATSIRLREEGKQEHLAHVQKWLREHGNEKPPG